MSNTTTFQELFDQYEKEDKLENLAAGEYVLEVTSCKPRKTDVQPIFKVVEGPHTGKKVLAGVLSWNGNGRAAFFRKLEGFGLGKDFFLLNPAAADIAKALEGRVVRVNLEVQEGGAYAGRNQLGFNITLVSTPPLPGIGGVPTVPSAAPTAAPTPETAPAEAAPPAVAAAPVAAAPVAAAPVAAAPVAAAPVAAAPVAAAPVAAAPVAAAPVAAVAGVPPAVVVVEDPGF